ncbi:hypothetical protein CE165_07885 [Bifidobacterium longum]|jgi:hypothetical protein|nr:hypothetical protein CE165_07885 [Bifidobacterium longum]
MMPGERQAKRKVSMPRTIGMVIFRILAIGVWIFALLIFVGGLSTDFLTCTIIALIISFIGWMLWVIGDMIHDPEKIRAEQRAARAAKDPSIVLDEDSERERKRAANGHWDGRANPGHAQPNDEASPALVGVEVEDGEALASARRETGQSSALSRTISLSPIIIPPKTLSVSATRETETVSGSYPATIYVYDPRPILKLKEGRAEKISVVTRPITLKSRLNGRQWRSGVDDGYAVEYKGKPFGVLFNHIAVIHIRAILESDAKNVELVAMRQGWYQTGVPEIYVMVPTLEEAKESETGNASLKEYEQRQAYGADVVAATAIFRVSENNWNGPRIPDEGFIAFEATVEQLPVPEGSQAKPHFALKSGGVLLSEITARSTAAYFASEPLVGKRLKILVSRYYTSLTIEAYEI